MNIRWGLRQDYYYVFIQKVKKITFFGVYSIGVLCSYLTNDNHLSINWFMQGFPFRKVPVEIASSAKITNGHPFIQILVWMDECYNVRRCLVSCTFPKRKKAIPSSSSVLCHGDISRRILRAEVGHFGSWCPTESLQHPAVLILASVGGMRPWLVCGSILKNDFRYILR